MAERVAESPASPQGAVGASESIVEPVAGPAGGPAATDPAGESANAAAGASAGVALTAPSAAPADVRVTSRDLSMALQAALQKCSYGEYDFIVDKTSISSVQRQVEKRLLKNARQRQRARAEAATPSSPTAPTFSPELMSRLVVDCVQSIASDSFWECFETPRVRPWNFSAHLWPVWALGVVFRALILFPFRLCVFVLDAGIGGGLLCLSGVLCPFCMSLARALGLGGRCKRIRAAFASFDRMVSVSAFRVALAMFGTVLQVHGRLPEPRPGRVYVANHTTVMDVALLEAIAPFSLIGQKYPGLLGFFESRVLGAFEPVWFNRSDKNDRRLVAQKIRQHVFNPEAKAPLCLFPEGVCVNNRYICMFKKGAFELGAEVVPIAIKYNEALSPHAYWNSRERSFFQHLLSWMWNWCLVCDVWFMEPERQLSTETPEEFAERVKLLIARQARLIPRPWNGYLKYITVSEKMIRQRRLEILYEMGVDDIFAEELRSGDPQDERSDCSSVSGFSFGGDGPSDAASTLGALKRVLGEAGSGAAAAGAGANAGASPGAAAGSGPAETAGESAGSSGSAKSAMIPGESQ